MRPGTTYVAPTRRLAHFLRARHDAACLARGLRVWPTPDVVTWPELLRRQFDLDRAAGRTAARWLDASHGLLVWEQIVRRDVDLRPVLLPAGLGAVAQRSWDLLHAYRIPSARPGRGCEPGGPVVRPLGRRIRAVAGAGRLARSRPGLADGRSAGRRHTTRVRRLRPLDAGAGELRRADHRTWIGMSPCVRQCLRTVALDAHVVECNDFTAELETAARWAAHRLQQRPDQRLALIVPELARERARVRRVLDRVLVPAAAFTAGPAPESTAYELAAARPLLDRPVVAAALGWLAACINPPALSDASALLRGAHDGAAVARVVRTCRTRREAAPVRRAAGRVSITWRARLAFTAVLPPRRNCSQRQRAREPGRESRLPSVWAPEFFGTVARHRLAWSRSRQRRAPGGAAPAIAARRIRRERRRGRPGAGGGRVRALARPGCRDTAFEPQEIAAPLLVIDPDTALGMHFDAIWVCGLDAARWPITGESRSVPAARMADKAGRSWRDGRVVRAAGATNAATTGGRGEHRDLQRAALRGRGAAAAERAGRWPAAPRRHRVVARSAGVSSAICGASGARQR